ncbi:phosphopantetheine-binding protein [Bacillus sp. 166amftsu]|uniref:phosphopantetheine-binding protein n=1 Tax=Bacillus sp. 166amftsu TaxID=1761753 RepID=UPI00089C27A6|nr:phosphopantetheine-binding protein [Bacillus sp. 166amftsu]SDZ37889.1 acyl carrier protein [Bacillus sp. 166amftsu]
MDKTDLRDKVIEKVNEVLYEKVSREDSTNLLKRGLDSISFIRIIVLLEDELEIEIEDDDILLENFNSVDTICNLISKYIVDE